MRISKLSVYNNITTQKSNKRPGRITRITPHVFVNQVSVKDGVDYMARIENASVNYVVDKDGKVGCNVPEDLRAWTSSSRANDEQAITMELASDRTNPYKMNDATIKGFIDLVVEICRRYNRNKVVYIPDKDKALAYTPKDNEFLITFHKWFAATACPGQWFLDNAQSIFDRINQELQGKVEKVETPKVSEGKFTVQLGAYFNVDRANAHANQVAGSFVIQIKDLYKVFIGKGSKVEMTQLKTSSHSGGFVTEIPDAKVIPHTDTRPLTVGDVVTLSPSATVYGSHRKFAKFVYNSKLYVRGIDGKRIVVSTQRDGEVTGAVDIKYIVR